jgi:hypothetical protein
MTTVFRGDLRDEGRFPDYVKTSFGAHGSEAAEKRIGKHQAAISCDNHVMGIDIAGEMDSAGHVEGIRPLFCRLSPRHGIIKPDDLAVGTHPQAAVVNA